MTVIVTGFIPLTTVRFFDNGYVGKQPVAWAEYCAEYWLKELQESMDRCTGHRDMTEILLKMALNTIQSIFFFVSFFFFLFLLPSSFFLFLLPSSFFFFFFIFFLCVITLIIFICTIFSIITICIPFCLIINELIFVITFEQRKPTQDEGRMNTQRLPT